MRKHVQALVAVAIASALAVPGTVLASGVGPTGPTALAAQPALPAGSLWDLGAAPACRTVTAPPEAPVGEAPVLVGRPGAPGEFCGAYAQVGPGGSLRLPGGIPGERLGPAVYAREAGQTVTVAYTATGAVVVYLS